MEENHILKIKLIIRFQILQVKNHSQIKLDIKLIQNVIPHNFDLFYLFYVWFLKLGDWFLSEKL